ncbi:MAG: cobalamin biosynthesis protein CbiD [Spirochaetes bacterium]|nr:cobalamin biosynthesis protein CbiD [Spirochaetota bacterium]
MLNNYKIVSGKKLRCGYTTGTCAAAAAKAAAEMLVKQAPVNHVSIDTPKGWTLNLDVEDISFFPDYARCCVIKDAGDDPDITNGMRIYAKVSTAESGIKITGGDGVGRVTKKGLSVEPGNPAINPVPMRMIENEVRGVLPENTGVCIEISVPGGESVAERTFNPKLGIEGGISIIGTSGIVEPMSEDSITESIGLELSMLRKSGNEAAVFVPGNYGEKYAIESLKIEKRHIVTVSNYIGDMLNRAVYEGFRSILFVGNIGKLVKVAGGIFNTHSKVADARVEILASHYALFTGNADVVKAIMESLTTEEAIEYIKDMSFFMYLAETAAERCCGFVHNDLSVEVVLFSEKKGLLGKSKGADQMIDSLQAAS